MKRRLGALVGAAILFLTLAAPALAGQSRTALWVCEVPEEGRVIFVKAAEAARYGLSKANDHAGQTFATQFGEDCAVL
jgi:hypothetical protein